METPATTKYNLLIIGVGGTGSVGFNSAHSCCQIEEIDKIFLHNRSLEKAVACRESILAATETDREIVVVEESDLEGILGEVDFSVISIGSRRDPDRLKQLNSETLEGLKTLGGRFRNAGYKGNTIVATNPVDIVSYVWALYSGQHPNTIVGLNYSDMKRNKARLCEALNKIARDTGVEGFHIQQKDIEAICIGPHTERAIPYLISVKGMPGPLTIVGTKDAFDSLRRAIDEAARFVYTRAGGTGRETGETVKQTLEAMIKNKGGVTGSVFLRLSDHPSFRHLPISDSDTGIYFGMPIHFEDFFVRMDDLEFRKGFELNAFYDEHRTFLGLLEKLRRDEWPDPDTGEPLKIEGYVDQRPEPKRTLGHKVEVPERVEKRASREVAPAPDLSEKIERIHVKSFGEKAGDVFSAIGRAGRTAIAAPYAFFRDDIVYGNKRRTKWIGGTVAALALAYSTFTFGGDWLRTRPVLRTRPPATVTEKPRVETPAITTDAEQLAAYQQRFRNIKGLVIEEEYDLAREMIGTLERDLNPQREEERQLLRDLRAYLSSTKRFYIKERSTFSLKDPGVYIENLHDGKDDGRVWYNDDYDPIWSPDGENMLLNPLSSWINIIVVDSDGGNLQHLRDSNGNKVEYALDAFWIDNNTIGFRKDNKFYCVDIDRFNNSHRYRTFDPEKVKPMGNQFYDDSLAELLHGRR